MEEGWGSSTRGAMTWGQHDDSTSPPAPSEVSLSLHIHGGMFHVFSLNMVAYHAVLLKLSSMSKTACPHCMGYAWDTEQQQVFTCRAMLHYPDQRC